MWEFWKVSKCIHHQEIFKQNPLQTSGACRGTSIAISLPMFLKTVRNFELTRQSYPQSPCLWAPRLTLQTLFHPQFDNVNEIGYWFRKFARSYFDKALSQQRTISVVVEESKFKTEGEILLRINLGEKTSLVPCFFQCTILFLTSHFFPSLDETGASTPVWVCFRVNSNFLFQLL